MPIVWRRNLETWIYGAASTFIGGGASVGAAIVIDPAKFNIHEGFKNLVAMFVAAGTINLLSYLKQSPLPKLIEEDTITITKTTTSTPPVEEKK